MQRTQTHSHVRSRIRCATSRSMRAHQPARPHPSRRAHACSRWRHHAHSRSLRMRTNTAYSTAHDVKQPVFFRSRGSFPRPGFCTFLLRSPHRLAPHSGSSLKHALNDKAGIDVTSMRNVVNRKIHKVPTIVRPRPPSILRLPLEHPFPSGFSHTATYAPASACDARAQGAAPVACAG